MLAWTVVACLWTQGSPTVTDVSPLPASLQTSPTSVTITLSQNVAPASVSAATVTLVGRGPDALFGTGDDVAVTPASIGVSGNVITLNLTGQTLPDGVYRVRLSGSPNPPAAPAGLFGHWKMDESTGTTVADSSGNGRTGTLNGAVRSSGLFGNAVRFNAGTTRVDIDAGVVTPGWTAALWVRRTGNVAGTAATLMDCSAFATGTSLRLEQFLAADQVGITEYTTVDHGFGYVVPLNTWVHLTFTSNGSNARLYVNGTLFGTAPRAFNLHVDKLGSATTTRTNSLIGLLDEVQVYTRVLTAGEISGLATVGGGGIRNGTGDLLDGEFSGTFPSGDGTAGGDFVATFRVSSGPAPAFTEVSAGLSAITASEVNWGDFDNDGDLDLALQGVDSGARVTRLYRNAGGTFVHETNAVMLGFNEGPIIFGDYDNDGDLDLAFGGWSGGGTGNRIHRNDGGGTFFFLNNGLRGMKGADGAWGDFDNDGDLDLVLAGESYDPPQGDYAQIYRNGGNDQFTLAVDLPGLYLGQVSLGDFDNDGDLDLALTGRMASRIFRNDGGAFTEIAAGLPALMNSAVAWGDFDNDGDLDLALLGGTGAVPTHFDVYRNDAGIFAPLNAGLPVVHTGEVDWGDFDNDGDLDLLVVGIDAGGTPVSLVYQNLGGGTFADAGLALTGVWDQSSAAWGDFDNDGDLDIVLAGRTSTGATIKVYRNDGGIANTPPSAPGGLSAAVGANAITFQWSSSNDAQTPAAGLSYNLRVGTTPGGQQIMAAMADLTTGWRRLPARGNAQQNLSWTVKNLPAGTYYYSVQAVDGGFRASAWASEQALSLSPAAFPPSTANTLTAGGCAMLGAEALVPVFLLFGLRRLGSRRRK